MSSFEDKLRAKKREEQEALRQRELESIRIRKEFEAEQKRKEKEKKERDHQVTQLLRKVRNDFLFVKEILNILAREKLKCKRNTVSESFDINGITIRWSVSCEYKENYNTQGQGRFEIPSVGTRYITKGYWVYLHVDDYGNPTHFMINGNYCNPTRIDFEDLMLDMSPERHY